MEGRSSNVIDFGGFVCICFPVESDFFFIFLTKAIIGTIMTVRFLWALQNTSLEDKKE